MGGINIMRMNPKTNYNGSGLNYNPWYRRTRHIANFPKKYSLNQIVIPFGIGIKVNLSHHSSFSMSMEYAKHLQII